MYWKNFAVIGGDARIIELANSLKKDGYCVNVYGLQNAGNLEVPHSTDLKSALNNAEAVILPLPTLDKNGNVFAPLANEPINLTSLFRLINPKQLIFAGNIPESVKQLVRINELSVIDYFQQEELTITNAMITAEGAVSTILNNYNKTLCNSKILILGYGRIGKFTAKILNGFGAQVTIGGRRNETQSLVQSMGLQYIDTRNAYSNFKAYDIIINTVPELILTKEKLEETNENCLILDVASGAGGTDFSYAEKINRRTIHALSLPGKTAPIAAGTAIKNTILNQLICLEV